MTAALPAMRAQGGGRIVNISSIGGKIGVAHLVPYCASKFALTGLSTSMHAELAQGQHPRDDGVAGADAHRLAVQRVVQGTPSRGVRMVRGVRLAAGADHRRARGRRVRSSTPAVAAMRSSSSAGRPSWRSSPTPSSPSAVAAAMKIANRLLPPAAERQRRRRAQRVAEPLEWAPSRLTRSTERAAVENNELLRSGETGPA